MDSQLDKPFSIVLFVLNATGCGLLSVLIVSISLSERLHRRDPVFNNFLYTWILLSANVSFDGLVVLSNQDAGNSALVREYVLSTITMVSTFNLSVHLWYIMRAAFHPGSPRSKKLRTFLLVVTPYACGLLALPTLFAESAGTIIVGLFWMLLAIITPILDVMLLVYYWRYYRKARQGNVNGAMSLSFLLRLLAFGVYRLVYTSLFVMAMMAQYGKESMSWFLAFKIAQNIFPLLAFCVLGLHTDILQLWFPCFWKRKGRAPDMERVISDTDATQRLIVKKSAEEENV